MVSRFEKKNILLHIGFLVVLIVMSVTIITAYYKFCSYTKYYNFANPLNLSIKNAYFGERNLFLLVKNPNNFSVSFVINIIGIRNSLGLACPVTIGGDVGSVLELSPGRTYLIEVPLYYGCEKVILPFKRGIANITVVIYYQETYTEQEGRVFYKIVKNK